MRRNPLRAVRGLLLILALICAAPLSAAEQFPSKPIRIIVPYPAGGGTDVLARVIATALSGQVGQQVFIDNRGGGDATIGSAMAARATPDGYTLLIVSGVPFVINQTVFSKLPYDTTRDLTAVSLFAQWPLVLVSHPSMPGDNFKDFITHIKTRQGELNYAGSDQMTYLAMEIIKQATGADILHVPYKGVAPSLADVVGGHVPTMLSSVGPAIPYINTGKLRALAVTGSARSFKLPDIPTVAESGVPGYEVNAWYGLFAPAGTPPDVVAYLNKKIAEAVASPEVKENFAALGAESVDMTPEAFSNFVKAEIARWAVVVKNAGLEIR